MTLRRRRQSGVAFIVAVVALAIIVALIAIFTETQRANQKVALQRIETRRARAAAEAGIQRGLASLQAVADAPTQPTTQADEWFTLGQNGGERLGSLPAALGYKLLTPAAW